MAAGAKSVIFTILYICRITRMAQILDNPITMIRRVLQHAADQGLPALDPATGERPSRGRLKLVMFPQDWNTTALGHERPGVAAQITAYTMVVMSPSGSAAIYFDGQHAYTIRQPGDSLLVDIGHQRMARASRAQTRYETGLREASRPPVRRHAWS